MGSTINDRDWKVPIESTTNTTTTSYCSLDDARQFFAVDASGSTAGRIIKREQAFVEKLHHNHSNDRGLTWGSSCGQLERDFVHIVWEGNLGGTQPEVLLRRDDTVYTIASSDVWYLLTDGEIGGHSVNQLSAS